MPTDGGDGFEARVARYRGQFKASLGSFRPGLLGRILGDDEATYGIDYYGVGRVREAVGHVPEHERVEFITFLFMDALLDAALVSRAVHAPRSRVLDRPVFVINTYNILATPSANITHRNPQVLLGLLPTWGAQEIAELGRCISDYIAGTSARLEEAPGESEELTQDLRALAGDRDLQPLDFSGPLGLRVPPEVRAAYLAALRGEDRAASSPPLR